MIEKSIKINQNPVNSLKPYEFVDPSSIPLRTPLEQLLYKSVAAGDPQPVRDAKMAAQGLAPIAAPRAANDNRIIIPELRASDWDGQPVPEQEWFIKDMVPTRTTTLLYGDGGVGKSFMALQIAVATAMGVETLGMKPRAGRVFYIGAEDEARIFHMRAAKLVTHLGGTFADLDDLHIIPLADQDSILMLPTKQGGMADTPLWTALKARICEFDPVLLVLDTAANLFGGNENAKSDVTPFIKSMNSIAMRADCTSLMLAHPSVAGMATGTSTAGSVGWHNTSRGRLSLTIGKGIDGEPDRTKLVLGQRKENYGPGQSNKTIKRLPDGTFCLWADQPVHLIADHDEADDALFLELLALKTGQNENLCVATGTSYAPAKMAAHPKGKATGKARLAAAMTRLIDSETIVNEQFGPPSKLRFRIVLAPSTDASTAPSTDFHRLPAGVCSPPHTPPFRWKLPPRWNPPQSLPPINDCKIYSAALEDEFEQARLERNLKSNVRRHLKKSHMKLAKGYNGTFVAKCSDTDDHEHTCDDLESMLAWAKEQVAQRKATT